MTDGLDRGIRDDFGVDDRVTQTADDFSEDVRGRQEPVGDDQHPPISELVQHRQCLGSQPHMGTQTEFDHDCSSSQCWLRYALGVTPTCFLKVRVK